MEVPAKFRSALVGFRYWLLALVFVATSFSLLACDGTSTTIIIGGVANTLTVTVESTTVHPNGMIEVTAVANYNDPDTGAENVTVGETIHFALSSNSSGASLSASSAVTNSAGRAMVMYTAGNTSGGSDSITAKATLADEGEEPPSATVTINVDQRPVGSILVDSGAAILVANGVSNTAIRATVLDNGGSPSVGTIVSFETTLGSLSDATAQTDSDGIAEVTLTAGTAPGTAVVGANGGGFNGQVDITFVAGVPDSISVSALPDSVDPNGQTTITATVKDENGNPIEGETVNFSVETNDSGGSLNTLSALTNVNGQASVTYSAGRSIGIDTIKARTASDESVSDTVDVEITAGSIAVGSISVVAGTGTLIADGSSNTVVRATVLDTNGQLASNILVTFSTTAGNLSATSATTDANGIAEVTLTSATNIGTAIISGNARGFVDTTQVAFIAGGVGNVTMTANPANILADGTSTSVISALVTDEDGNPVANGEVVTFSITSGGGTISSLTAATVNGVASVTFTSPTVGTGTILRGESTNGEFGTVTIVYTTEQVASIALALGTSTLVANGVQSTIATATATNTDGNPVSDGTIVTFTIPANGGDIDSTSAGTQLTANVPTTGGIAVAVLTSSTTAGQYVMTATSSGVGQLQSYELTPGFADGGFTTITPNPNQIDADGISTSVITVVAHDENDNPVADGTTVNFYTNLGTITPTGSTAFGVATATLTSGMIDGQATVTAVVDGVTVTTTVDFGFVAGVGSGTATTIELSVSTDSIRVQGSGGQESAVITATARDETGNPITNCTDNMRFTIINGPGGGEQLDGVGTTVDKSTSSGTATVSLTSGTISGTVTIQVSVILDGDCGTGGGAPPYDVLPDANGNYASALTTPIGIEAGEPANIIIFQPTVVIENDDGSISQIVSVLVQDQYGNPVEDDTVIFFGLVDNPPTSQFPDRNGYKVSGDGSTILPNIFQSVTFTTGFDFLNDGLNDNDTLIIFEGQDEGGHIIQSRTAVNALTLFTNPLNAAETSLPFVAGTAELGTVCGVMATGNLEPDGTCNPSSGTSIKGVAHSRITWTPQGIFKPFYLYAESAGRTVGDAIGDSYPAVAPVAITVTIIPPSVTSGQQDIQVFAEYIDGGDHRIPDEEITFFSSNDNVASFGGPPPGGTATTTGITNSAGRASTDDLDTVSCLSEQTSVTITAASGPFSGNATLTIQASPDAPTAGFTCADAGDGNNANCLDESTTPAGTNITAWSWDIDCNGSIESGAQNPTLALGPGTTDVCLTVTNDAGCSDDARQEDVSIAAGAPGASFVLQSDNGDGTADLDDTSSTAPGTTNDTWLWTFPAGTVPLTSTNENPLGVNFGASTNNGTPGIFIVQLQVTNDASVSDTTTQTVSLTATPTADYEWSDNGDGTASFDAAGTPSSSTPGTTTITNYAWTFASGTPASSPTNAVATAGPVDWGTVGPGPHNVTLQVTNNFGDTDSTVKAVTVSATPTAVQAVPVATTGSGGPPCGYDFDGSASSSGGTSITITSYDWSYGDGNALSGMTAAPSHTFTTAGPTFSVDLTVTNNFGDTSVVDTQVVPCPVP